MLATKREKQKHKYRCRTIAYAQRCGYLPTPFKTLDELRQQLDKNLFRLSRYNPLHVLHRLLPHPNVTGYNLLQRAHNLTLPSDINSTTKQNFIFRMLFDDMYWTVLFRMFCVLFILCDFYCICTCYTVRLSFVH